MSSTDGPPGKQKYYDPGEVEAYVREVTSTIKTLQTRLQEMTLRAEAAERAVGEQHPETASLGRALLLAGEVADKTIADADAKGADIVRAAEERAVSIIDAANAEAGRIMDSAGGTAAEIFEKGEARLLAAVSAFMEGSNILRSALAKIEEDATSWRSSLRTATRHDTLDARPATTAAPNSPFASNPDGFDATAVPQPGRDTTTSPLPSAPAPTVPAPAAHGNGGTHGPSRTAPTTGDGGRAPLWSPPTATGGAA